MSESQQPNRDKLPLEVEQKVDRLSDEFESAWKKGRSPRIEEYLPQITREYLPAFLRQLVALEVELRAANNEHPGVDEFVARFPDQRQAVLSFGDNERLLDRYAFCGKPAYFHPPQVKQKMCNAWGLFDMHGSVMEWCQDWHEVGTFRVY